MAQLQEPKCLYHFFTNLLHLVSVFLFVLGNIYQKTMTIYIHHISTVYILVFQVPSLKYAHVAVMKRLGAQLGAF